MWWKSAVCSVNLVALELDDVIETNKHSSSWWLTYIQNQVEARTDMRVHHMINQQNYQET